MVLGAGGASRSIVYALLDCGVKSVHVVNRTFAKAEAMRETFGSGVKPAAWDDVPGLLEHVGLVVNTTSLGMHGQPPLAIDLTPLANDAIVSDIVYVPLQTPLLAAAAARMRRSRRCPGRRLSDRGGDRLWTGPVLSASA